MILHILNIFVASFVATIFLLPFSSIDVYYVATFNLYNPFLTSIIILTCEIINALIAYKLASWLITKVIRKEKTKQKFEKVSKQIIKYGWWLVLVAAATPFPYTLTIYAVSISKWGNNQKLISAVALGKAIKIALIGTATYFGFKIF